MRSMEDECLNLEAAMLSVKKAFSLIVEASDKTPPTIASRALIESALSLLSSALNTLFLLEKSICSNK